MNNAVTPLFPEWENNFRDNRVITRARPETNANHCASIIRNVLRDFGGAILSSDHIRRIGERANVQVHHPNAWGQVFRSLQRMNAIEETGDYVRSRRPGANSRIVRQWRVT